MTQVPGSVRKEAAKSFAKVIPKALLGLIPSLTAPLVVPFILLFTKRQDNALPSWARWYDNDVSINGDIPEYWASDYMGDCYYAKGHHPRSFWARYVWLGWRNRASWLFKKLGYTYISKVTWSYETYGTQNVSRSSEGWQLNIRDKDVYQLYIVKKLGKFCYRLNWGHKIWTTKGSLDTADIVAISFSILTWQGA